jgi:hypothetical protein
LGVHDSGAEGKALVTGVITVGLSSIFGLTSIPGQIAPTILRWLNGGTCEIVGTGGTMNGTGFTMLLPALNVGSGFQLRSGDPSLSLNTSGNIYFLSSGATTQVSFIQHRTADFS